MKKKRKNKADTTASAVQLATATAPGLPLHIKLEPQELIYFQAIIDAKAYKSWNDVDIDLAANLARSKAKIEKLEQELKKEQNIVENAAGTPIPNPKFKMIEDLAKRVVVFTRLLQVHPLATVGQSKDQF